MTGGLLPYLRVWKQPLRHAPRATSPCTGEALGCALLWDDKSGNDLCPAEGGHQQGDEDELEEDAGDGVHHRSRRKGAPGEGRAGKAHDDHHGAAPEDPSRHHGGDEGGVGAGGGFGLAAGQDAGDDAVGGKLHRHAKGGHEGRHVEEEVARQGGQKPHCSRPGGAAEEARQKNGQVHGAEHGADLGDLPGEEGQHQAEGQAHGGVSQVAEGLVHLDDLPFVCLPF